MKIWDEASAVLLERSSAGNTGSILGADDVELLSCDGDGAVVGAGAAVMTATFAAPAGAKSDAPGASLKRLRAQIDVAGADGTPAGTLGVQSFKATPFSKKMTILMRGVDGAEIGTLSTSDKKGRELVLHCDGAEVASLALVDRDRSISRTVERWSLDIKSEPTAKAELLAAAAVLRYGKLLAEVSAPG